MNNKRIRCWLLALVILSSFSIVACGRKENEATKSMEQSVATKEQPMTVSKQSATSSKPSMMSSGPSDTGLKKFSFVDSKGKQYEESIDSAAKIKTYDDACFSMQGNMRYEDDRRYSRLGIDVSYYQGDIDWNAVKQSGYEFVFIRAGYRKYQTGTINSDKQFKRNIEGANKAGIDVGVYFYSQACNEDEVKEEVQFVLEQIKGYDVNLPVVYDQESSLDDSGRSSIVTREQATNNAVLFCDMISKAGHEPMVYCDLKWEAFMYNMGKLAKYPIWYAGYESKPQTPYDFRFWQFSNTGRVSGINGDVDIDIKIIDKMPNYQS